MGLNGKSSASAPGPLLKNAAAAPVVYFDNVPVFGTFGGNIEIELAARLLMPKADGSVFADMSCTAHLRASPAAIAMLMDACEKALAMHARQQGEQQQPEERSALLAN